MITSVPQLSIVVPMLNEEANVSRFFDRLFPVMAQLHLPHEVICVDDGSRDRTAERIRTAQKQHPALVLVQLTRNFGQHAAVMAGFQQARGDWVITLDADLQNPPEEIPRVLAELRKGHDVVGTIRQRRRDSRFRTWASKLTYWGVRKITHIPLTDLGCMLRGYTRTIAHAIAASNENRLFIPALACALAANPVEIPVSHEERSAGRSHYSLLKLFSLQLDLITSSSIYPLRLLFVLGMALAVTGCLLGCVLLLFRFLLGSAWANQGTLTVLGILSVFSGFQFIALGFLGEYLGRIFQQVRTRAPFLVLAVEPSPALAPAPLLGVPAPRPDAFAPGPATPSPYPKEER